ncbi:hypothetical protein HRbin30_02977 [bacterium HR30]|nr:hypothetical protein HRbin30_02977 [bacterium HR30]
MMKRWLLGSLLGGALICAAPSAWAVRHGPCASDIEKFCQDVKPGKGRYRACLKAHESELSDACKKHLEQPQKHMRWHKR